VGLSTRRDRLRPAWSGWLLQNATTATSLNLAARLNVAMSSGDDREWKTYVRSAVLGLAVVASTIAADLAAFIGRPDFSKLETFGFAGLLAAVVVLLTSGSQKKCLSGY
jgi:hypothetical protein